MGRSYLDNVGCARNVQRFKAERAVFEGFALDMVELSGATLRVRHGGSGPPLLLLHGHLRTHATWLRVAPLLAERYTVVCPDLRGFGRSSKPADTPDHFGSSKRAKARDYVALMRHLGFDRSALVGHDRGSYIAFRTAMDHPVAVTYLAILDGMPIVEAWNAATPGSPKPGGTGSFSPSRTSWSGRSSRTLVLGTAAP